MAHNDDEGWNVAILTVTSDTGGTTQPVRALYVPPGRDVPDAGSGTALADTGLDAAFTADLLSACLAHERCGVHLYRSVAGRTTDDELRAHYVEFGEETLRHVEILEELITASGGDPAYVSPSARATEKAAAGILESTFLLAGSVDPITAELAMLEAVQLAETKDHGNWELLGQLALAMADGPVREATVAAVDVVLAQEEKHWGWAADTRARLLFRLATGGLEMPTPAPAAAEEPAIDLDAVTRDELYATAQELDIPGRSSMTKDELAAAIEEHR
jgi:rubrerythrin